VQDTDGMTSNRMERRGSSFNLRFNLISGQEVQCILLEHISGERWEHSNATPYSTRQEDDASTWLARVLGSYSR